MTANALVAVAVIAVVLSYVVTLTALYLNRPRRARRYQVRAFAQEDGAPYAAVTWLSETGDPKKATDLYRTRVDRGTDALVLLVERSSDGWERVRARWRPDEGIALIEATLHDYNEVGDNP